MSESCTLLKWDTAFFGRRIARVNGNQLDAQLRSEVQAWCAAQQVECLYFLADSGDPATIQEAETGGFRLQDVRLTFSQPRPSYAPDHAEEETITDGVRLRPSRITDLDALHDTARHAYVHSRFYNDPHFSREQCAALYDTWLTRSIREQPDYADIAFVAELDGVASGYVTCKVNAASKTGIIGLVGVTENARGQSLGQKLMTHALCWFWAQGMAQVQVTTQGRNIAGQRLYQRAGFLTESMRLWYHWWHDEHPQL